MNENQDYTRLYPAPGAPAGEPEPPKPFVMHSEEAPDVPPPFPDASPQPAAGKVTYQQNYTPPPPKEKKPFNPIPLLLAAGVAFLFLGGIIFLTGTWETLPNGARAAALLSAGVVAFGANILAERVLKLPKTGLAFYILGCIFLPLALAGIGAFQLFGEWFSFEGGGACILEACISACVAVIAAVGQKNYRSKILAGFSIGGTAVTGGLLSLYAGTECIGGLTGTIVTLALWLLCSVGLTVWTEWELQRRPQKDSPYAMAAMPMFTASLFGFLIAQTAVVMDTKDAMTGLTPLLLTGIFLLQGVLFCNPRLICGHVHAGVFGFIPAVLTGLECIFRIPALEADSGETFTFTFSLTIFLLMSTRLLPGLREEMRSTFSGAGEILSIIVLLYAGMTATVSAEHVEYFILFIFLLTVGCICFGIARNHPLTKDTPLCVAQTAMVFVAAVLAAQSDSPAYPLLLVCAALVLLVQFLLSRRVWTLVLGLCACAGMLLVRTPEPVIALFWTAAGILLAGTVYAHLRSRVLLEQCMAWGFLSLLFPAVLLTGKALEAEEYAAWAICAALLLLLTLLEQVPFAPHLRSKGTLGYLTAVTLPVSFLALMEIGEAPVPWKILLFVTLLVLSGILTTRRINVLALPELIMTYVVFRNLTLLLDGHTLLMVLCNLGLLVVFAAMGHFLVPKFIDTEDKAFRVDFPLTAGVLPIFGGAAMVGWYPSIVVSLLLAVYALAFIPRVRNKRMPMVLSSLCFCAALLFHTVNDPFGILEWFRGFGIITIQLLMYLLPMHVFLLSLRFILPAEMRGGVDLARFVMYCITMLCLLLASFFFGNVTDAIVLAGFSFAILVGSFAVKRLRWFALGFVVLVVMTIRLTWSFWTSLHWGIYLFLAGILLIAMASLYEYRSRMAQEHPERKAEKPRLFKDWKM